MGCTASKLDNEDTVRRCKERRRLMKDAVYARHHLAAAHADYCRSLRLTGAALVSFSAFEPLDISHQTPAVFLHHHPTPLQPIPSLHVSPSPPRPPPSTLHLRHPLSLPPSTAPTSHTFSPFFPLLLHRRAPTAPAPSVGAEAPSHTVGIEPCFFPAKPEIEFQ
ncbi:hypothetical protein Pyn_37746 [Prunus yedoensis var. nudiflora]|uniref:DUF630 domain-containing protein n=1 Tax=Prunus yedoensis var. nudiflora TaxID=2094558 RepID=A0A314UHA6_PRUYE|nr:hypothetical protein Pyn_37746 [Prunus yedoensis var. nudiflora]